MIITHKINMDLITPRPKEVLNAVQSDAYCRKVEIVVTAGGQAVEFPDDVSVRGSYRKADGTRGIYDTMPDGETKAGSVVGNVVTLSLAPQMLTAAGVAELAIQLISGETLLNVFPVQVNVAALPGFGGKSENYYSVSGLPQITEADNGKVLTVEDGMWVAADPTGGDGSGGQGGTTVVQSEPVISGKWALNVNYSEVMGTIEQDVKFKTTLAIYEDDEGNLLPVGSEDKIVSYHSAVCSKMELVLDEGMASVTYTVESTDAELQAVLDASEDGNRVPVFLGTALTLGGTWYPGQAKYVDFGGAQEVSKEFLDAFKTVASLYYGGTDGEGAELMGCKVTEATDGTITMVNTLSTGTETIVITPDANGNPASVTVNGTAIPVAWTEATTE